MRLEFYPDSSECKVNNKGRDTQHYEQKNYHPDRMSTTNNKGKPAMM